MIKMAVKGLMLHKMRTFLTLGGITIGVAAIVFLVSFGYGVERLVTKELSGGDAFSLIDVGVGNSKIIKLDEASAAKIKNLAYVKSTEPMIAVAAKTKKNETEFDSAFFGTSPTFMDLLPVKVKYGQMFAENQSEGRRKEIVVNSAFLKIFGNGEPESFLGQVVEMDLIIPKELTTEDKEIKSEKNKYIIVGIVQDEGNPSVYTDYRNVLAAGATAYSQVKVQLEKKDKARELRKQIENLGFKTDYVGDTVTQVEQVFNIFKLILASFGLIALIVAALGMFNTLTISLMERIREVALMKILGMQKKDINRVFLSESIILGTVGGIFGILVGISFANFINLVLNILAIRAGGEPASVFYSPVSFILLIFVFSFLISFLTGWYPAQRATKTNPLDVFRYE